MMVNMDIWLVVDLPLSKICFFCQLGWWHSQNDGKKQKKHVWKHQKEMCFPCSSNHQFCQIPQSTNMWGMEQRPPLVTSVWLLISNIHTLPMGYDHAVTWHYICVEYMSHAVMSGTCGIHATWGSIDRPWFRWNNYYEDLRECNLC